MKTAAVDPRLPPPGSPHALERYYALHARVYDATRWSFLFGRDLILELAAGAQPHPARILEIGCGTGRNLVRLARLFPHAHLTGVDLAPSMLAVARRRTAPYGPRISLRAQAYDAPLDPTNRFDLVLCSYALTMFNPGFAPAITAAHADLAPGGYFAFVDFHASRHRWFTRWMGVNHVRMEGHLRPLLQSTFAPVIDEVHSAYGGLWDYALFLGRRPKSP